MFGIKENSLQRALAASHCAELPRLFNENNLDFWIKAIGLVRKSDGTQSYCLLEHRADGLVVYKQDFGTMSTIYSLLAVYPYVFLDKEKYMPRNKDKRALCAALAKIVGLTYEYLCELDDEQLEVFKLDYAIRQQELENEAFDKLGVPSGVLEESLDVNGEELEQDEDGFSTIVDANDVKGEPWEEEAGGADVTSDGDEITDIVSAPSSSKKRTARKAATSTTRSRKAKK